MLRWMHPILFRHCLQNGVYPVEQVTCSSRIRQIRRFLSMNQVKFQSKPEVDSVTAAKVLKKPGRKRFGPVSWVSFSVSLAAGAGMLLYMWKMRQEKLDKIEQLRRQAIGKSLIGGPWELVNMNGKEESWKDYLGKWLVIYFGFTHCPDICPDSIEKMCEVVTLLQKDSDSSVVPLFFSVDPERDTKEAVKKYCEEFSSKLVGFTGTKEQVAKVARAFRVYFTEGPRDEFNDYIVDHSVIMYLVDPTGQFIDYYGQNMNAREITNSIIIQMLKYDKGKKKGWW